jgi:predicted ATPase/class 3 adenylate cyclase/Tfp pilus assembly protein PilF
VAESRSEMRTFLFTDIEGSTRLWERQPRAMAAALAQHDALLRAAIQAADGAVFKTAGDAFYAVFPSPAAAIAAAIAAQRALTDAGPEMAALLRVRMAIHAGEAEARDGDFFGPPLNRVARLLTVAHGQQVLVSRAAADLARERLPADVELRDLGLHALKDLPQPERIFQIVAPGLATTFPPLRTPDHLLRSVPRHPTPLIGREREIAAARRLFGLAPDEAGAAEPPVRLLTLTGPGGAGKTRLALHLALTLGVEFADGAAFVSLAELTDPALAPAAIAAVLDRVEVGGDAPSERLIEQLRERQMLLVLDNFEQVMGATATAAELLAACPRLTILATSRERLNLRGEHELPLPPLALPAPSSGASGDALPAEPALAEIERADAVRLFVERAQSVKPGFALTADNAAAVVEICRRLDGLPLAIELAAARIRLLPPAALLARLDRRLDLLGGGSRDLPARQQTMRTTIAWSYDLLDSDEQRRFARASIFAGGATLDAFAAIADDGDDPLGALDALASLADKSLLRIVEDGDESRLAMLETIRDFGRERLADWGDSHEIGRRHAAFYLAVAEAAEPQLQGSGQTRALDRLEADRANLRAALEWLRDHGATEAGLRLGGALWRFWWLRGDVGEGRAHLEALLAQPAPVAPGVRAKALNGAGVLADAQGDWDAAARLHQESLDLSRALGDARGVAWSLNNLGVVALNQGDYERAEALLQENLAVAEATGDPASIATAQIDLGQLALCLRDHERATVALERGLTLFRRLGDESHVARTLNNLGYMALQRGDYARADALLSESLALHRSVGDRQGIAGTLNNLAEVATALGNLEPAARLYLESHALALEGGNRLYAAIAMENLAALARRRGESRLAQHRFREALLLYHAVGDWQGIAASLSGLAAIAAVDDAAADGATLLGAVAAIAERRREIEPPDVEVVSCALRAAMGEAAFAIAWERGQTDPIDAVIARATGEIGMAAPRPA